MDLSSNVEEKLQISQKSGTLAIDLGNTTTVVAFQDERGEQPELIDLPQISKSKGEVPSLVWYRKEPNQKLLIGQQVINEGFSSKDLQYLQRDFKRLIKSPAKEGVTGEKICPEKAGEILIKEIWKRLPKDLNIKRLVLTAPVECYRSYRQWLLEICDSLEVDEIALVDEPTAAAMGSAMPAGAKLLVFDLGGSTFDIALVELEGGEGRAAPIAQLLRFNGEDLGGSTGQTLRCAKVLGKSGIQLGGRDIDRWIANHLLPDEPISEKLLNVTEKLKCKLSNTKILDNQVLEEVINFPNNYGIQRLNLSREILDQLLIEKGFLNVLDQLMKQTLASGRSNGCDLADLDGVIAVGGSSRIPLFINWLKTEIHPLQLLTPPPVEAVALGALKLTPGVTIKDVLHKGIALRFWDPRTKKHIWHNLFPIGQPWPTSNNLEIVLATSEINQTEIEIIIGEKNIDGSHEVIYEDNLPTVLTQMSDQSTKFLLQDPLIIPLEEPGQPGEDCLNLNFSINQDCSLQVEGLDIRSGRVIHKQQLCKLH